MNEIQPIKCPFCDNLTKMSCLDNISVCLNHNVFISFCFTNHEIEYIYLAKNGLEVEFSNKKAKLFKYDKLNEDDLYKYYHDILRVGDYMYDGSPEIILEIDFFNNKTFENYEKIFFKLTKMVPFI